MRLSIGSVDAKPVRHVQVLDRAMAILDVFAENGGDLALAEVAADVHLNKSTVHRLLTSLRSAGYIEQNAQTARYSLGSKLIQLGTAALANRDLCQIVRPFLRRLVAETGETAHLGVLREGRVVSMASVDGPRTLRTPSTVGRSSPAHCSSLGKVILAFVPEEEMSMVIEGRGLRAYTQNTITSRAALKAELRRIGECGFAIDNEEYEDGLRCVGAPVRDHSGTVIAAVSVAGAAVRLDLQRIPALARSVISAAADLSAMLGYRGGESTGAAHRNGMRQSRANDAPRGCGSQLPECR